MLQKLGIASAITVIAVFAVSTASFGGSGDGPVALSAKRALLSADFEARSAHRAAVPRGTSISGVRGAHLQYFRTVPFPVPANGRDDSYLLCPRRFKAISGFFNTDGGIVEDGSFSGPGLRRWNFGLTNLTGVDGNAYLGIVCLSGIGQ